MRLQREYPGTVGCLQCGGEYGGHGTVYEARGGDLEQHLYCPNVRCLGHTYGRSLFTVYVEFA